MNFTKLNNNGLVDGFGILTKCEKKTSSRGGAYLDMILSDNDGEISAKLWDYNENTHGKFETDMFVKVRGTISQYNGADQLRVEKMRKVTPEDNVDITDYVRHAGYTGEYMYNKITETINAFSDEDLKKLVGTIFTENKEKLLKWPAAYKLHHAIRGGLLMHTLSIVKLCEGVCEVYPFVDKDLLLSGAILHDIAKTLEFNVGETGLANGYSVEGNLIGHLVMGAMMVREAADKLGTDKKREMLLEHMILSHHGEPEFGAAVRPLFLEAELLSELDLMDARVYQIHEAISPLNEDDFPGRLWALDNRKIYNHGLADNKKDVDLD